MAGVYCSLHYRVQSKWGGGVYCSLHYRVQSKWGGGGEGPCSLHYRVQSKWQGFPAVFTTECKVSGRGLLQSSLQSAK